MLRGNYNAPLMLVHLIAWLLTAAIPPLTAEQLRDIDAARDGTDHRDQAVYAIVEHVRTWSSDAAIDDVSEPIHLTVDPVSLNARPMDFRGELFRIEGELLQQTPLAPPYDDVIEWFIREQRTALPVIAYVVLLDEPAAFAERQRVRVDSRFVKRVRFTARDGTSRDYPAFVGRHPIALAAGTQSAGASAPASLDALWIVGSIVAALLVMFVIVRIWASRQTQLTAGLGRSATRLRSAVAVEQRLDDAADLPDDPIDALAELRRRAGK